MIQPMDNVANYSAVKININNPQVNVSNNKPAQIATDSGEYSAVNINIDNPSVNTEPKKIYDYPESKEIVAYDMANIQPIALPTKPETPSAVEPATATEVEVPAPNYTTVEAEKGDNIKDDVKVMEAETKEVKKPEIIEGKEIKPEVDIPLVIDNLSSENYDTQAQQMEEIARISMDNPANAVPYIVREVFSSLIDITKKDTSALAAPNEEQVNARKKIMANYIALENTKTPQDKLPYELTEKEIALANELSPMEQAERNKEYALYTMAILAKVYTDEVEKQTGNIVPMTDIPGTSAIVDALRYNPNSGVKIAAIDALRHISRPEYKEEMTTLFTLAQADTNPMVKEAAGRAIERINNPQS